MGNFGKRLLIVLLSAVAFVTLALVGNAYQQAERLHKVSKQSDVIYTGKYENKTYEITKEDAWKAIVASDASENIVEMLNMYLLKSVIDGSWSQAELDAKKDYLVYGTTDAETIAEYKEASRKVSEDESNVEKYGAKAKQNDKLVKAFNDKMAVLGYTGGEGHTVEDYLKYQLAMDKYARYRLENNLTVSGKSYEIKDEDLKTTYSAGYKDTYALAIKFYSLAEAEDFIQRETNKLAIVSSEIRYYVSDQKYKVESVKSDDVLATLSDEGYNFVKTTLTISEVETEVNVPNAGVATKTEDSKTVYQTIDTSVYKVADTETAKFYDQGVVWKSSASTDTSIYALYFDTAKNDWCKVLVSKQTEQQKMDGDTPVLDDDQNPVMEKVTVYDDTYISRLSNDNTLDTVIAKKDVTTFSTSNTVALTDIQFLNLYINLYNEFYLKQSKSVPTAVSAYIDAANLTDDQKATLKDLGFVVVDNEIRKYVGNEEYVVDFEKSTEGYPVYKQYTSNETSKDIPNYKVEMDGDSVKLDSDGNLIYILDSEGNKQANDSKKAIADCTEFTTANTIKANAVQIYALYIQLNDVKANENDTETAFANMRYEYEIVNASRSGFASKLFTSLSITSAGASYTKTATDLESTTGTNDPYYLVFKLSDSTIGEPTAEELATLKEDKINEYLLASGFVAACMAELRGEAGLVIYDKYFSIDYENDIAYNSSSNTYGVNDEDSYKNYFKEKGYKANKIAKLTKKVNVEALGINTAKYVISADDLYNYSMESSGASYISNAASEKILLEMMPEFTQIHGKKNDYLTSKNWLMKLYAQTVESYNQQFEYYKQLYAAYGYDYYDNVSEYLYANGCRSYDDMVKQLEKSTMKNILIYKELVGSLQKTDELTAYGKEMLTDSNDTFKSLREDYMSLDVNHLLIGIDLDEDGSPDNYDDFLADLAENKTGLVIATDDSYEKVVNRLYLALNKYIDENATSLSTLTTALSNFVTEYNKASRIDSDYAEFKQLGITLTNETFEITRSTLSNYDEKFQAAVVKLQEKLERTDDALLGYSIYDGLCRSSFGDHFIVASACDSLTAPSFNYVASSDLYAAGLDNDDPEGKISKQQIIIYIQQTIYTTIFGNTDNPEANAEESGYKGFKYPNIPTNLQSDIESIYGDYIDTLLDTTYSYHTTYIILSKLVADNNPTYVEQFKTLQGIYKDTLLED